MSLNRHDHMTRVGTFPLRLSLLLQIILVSYQTFQRVNKIKFH